MARGSLKILNPKCKRIRKTVFNRTRPTKPVHLPDDTNELLKQVASLSGTSKEKIADKILKKELMKYHKILTTKKENRSGL